MLRCITTDIIPTLAFVTGALTIMIPVIIVHAQHVYIGGLVWPFIADLSRDYPSSAVFTIGLNVLALLVAITWMLNYRRHQRFLQTSLQDDDSSGSFRRVSYAANALGIAGACMLPLYQSTKVATRPHRFVGTVFLILEALACIANSYLSYRVCLIKREELEAGVFVTIKYAPRSVAVEKLTALKKAKRGFLVELACSALFLMSAIVYLPLLYQVAPPRHLTVAECVRRGFGDHYCNDTVRLDGTDTALWSYEVDFAGYQVRAFAQLGCILTLLTYTLSFVVSNNEQEENENMERDQMYHTAISRNTPGFIDEEEQRGRRRSRSRPGSPAKRSSRVRSPSGSPPKRSSAYQSPRAAGLSSPRSGPKSHISV